MSEAGYYLGIAGQTQGPFALEHIREWHEKQQLDPSAVIWNGEAWVGVQQYFGGPSMIPSQVTAPETASAVQTVTLSKEDVADEDVIKAINGAAGVGYFVAALTGIVAVISIFAGSIIGITP